MLTLILASLIAVSPPTEGDLPSRSEIDAINEKGKNAVTRMMRTQTEYCGAPLVAAQNIAGVNAPEGAKLCQDSITKRFRIVFPNPTEVNGEYRMDIILGD